jgi:hypothetical protein
MKKIFVVAAMLLLMVGMVAAIVPKAKIVLANKDPSTWDATNKNGRGDGYLFLYQTNVRFSERVIETLEIITGHTVKYIDVPRNHIWFEVRDVAQLRMRNMQPLTDYTLIYYGDETHNDVWPYATCLASFTSNTKGMFTEEKIVLDTAMLGGFLTDDVAQKYWIVTSSDVNCNAGVMTAWNPEQYFFEQSTA